MAELAAALERQPEQCDYRNRHCSSDHRNHHDHSGRELGLMYKWLLLQWQSDGTNCYHLVDDSCGFAHDGGDPFPNSKSPVWVGREELLVEGGVFW